MNYSSDNSYEFGPFLLDGRERLLLRNGQVVQLPPKAFDTLVLLAENGGHLLTKEEMLKRLWPDAFVEEANLTNNVSLLRKALGETDNGATFIQTVPRVGYRFVAAVKVNGLETHGARVGGEASSSITDTRRRWSGPSVKTAVITASAVVLAVAGYLWLARPRATHVDRPTRNVEFTQLTNSRGEETYPSLSPDGKLLAYVSLAAGKSDIYLLRIGGNKPINLTADSKGDHFGPVFSPDGNYIAFGSTRDGGGLFVMGATGENLKRLSEFGAHPSWSPDQKEMVFATDQTFSPGVRRTNSSELWIVNVETSEKRRLTNKVDATQPDWSPHGSRIAFWGQSRGGARNIFTIASQGGEPLAVTDDGFVNWNPVWSPDGRYLYFASDRGGSMNLWRVPISEQSGQVLGLPESVTAPSSYTQHLSFSKDPRYLAYVNVANTESVELVQFDPEKELVVGEPKAIIQRTTRARQTAVSPDGQWLAYCSCGEKQEDLFITRTDGSGLTQLTNDTSRDRAPRWSPDGKRLAFSSDRSGNFEIWMIRPDGSELRQITSSAGSNATWAVWSPDSGRLAYRVKDRGVFITEIGENIEGTAANAVSLPHSLAEDFRPVSWSPDGRKLAGFAYAFGARGNFKMDALGHRLCIYSFETQHYEKFDFEGVPFWLADSRKLIFGDIPNDRLYLLDTVSGKRSEVISRPLMSLEGFSISPDGRKIFLETVTLEADIWLVNLTAGKTAP